MASYCRDICKEYVERKGNFIKLEGEIEVDESLFGRKCKYHHGNPNVGQYFIVICPKIYVHYIIIVQFP